MLLSAVSVLVVAQSSSENPEGLMNNNPVYMHPHFFLQVRELEMLQHDTVYINMQLPLFIRVASLLTAITNSKYFPESALCQGTICVSNRKSGFCCECHTCLADGAQFVRFLSIRLLWHKASP